MEIENDEQDIIQRVAALDIGKAELVCCVRVPGRGRSRMQEVRTFTTMTRSLLVMSDWLTSLGVTRVVMAATSDYWRPPFYLLELCRYLIWGWLATVCDGGKASCSWSACLSRTDYLGWLRYGA